MNGNIVGAMLIGVLLGAIAAGALLANGANFLLALLAYSLVGSVGLLGAAALGTVGAQTARNRSHR